MRRISIPLAVVGLISVAALTGCAGGPGAAGCTTDVTFTNITTGSELDVSSTAAVSLSGGAAYTIYVADFDLDMESVSAFSAPPVPEGGNLGTIAITVFNATGTPEPITAGTTAEASTASGELVFVVTAAQGAQLYGNNAGAGGELTVTEVGSSVCIEVDYSDDEKAVSGTIGAAVKDL